MTRVNVVPPGELTGKHLLAEYRELPRIFALAADAYSRDPDTSKIDAPADYVLGPGHVKFFYDKLEFLERRFDSLVAEMRSRGYVPMYVEVPPVCDGLPESWWRDYEPTPQALQLNRARIRDRLAESVLRRQQD